MRLSMIGVVARAEIRTNRRLIHYWVYAVLAVVVGVATYGQFSFLHGTYSGMSATIGMVGPRYLISQTGFNLLVVFLAGITFLAFDVRARDARDRMSELLESRPPSNGDYMTGKVLGLVLIAWLPLVLVCALYALAGVLSAVTDLPLGDSVEPMSLLGFLLHAFSALFLWCCMIALLAMTIRYRLLIAVVSLGLIALQFWAALNVPLYILQWTSLMPSLVLASDILPTLGADGDGLRMLAYVVFGAGLLCVATALNPRRDGSSKRETVLVCVVMLSASIALLGANVWLSNQRIEQGAIWRAAHEANQARPRADLKSLSGTLVLNPGESIAMNLDLEVIVPPGEPSSTILFTLNPGISIEELTADGIRSTWTHSNGLFEVALPEPADPGAVVQIALMASGEPNEAFGYLDTHLNPLDHEFTESQIVILGTRATVFDDEYIGMTPGGHWLPSTGTATPISDPRTHPLDYFILDVQVHVPEGWLVAGPGRRLSEGSDGQMVRYRFRPDSPVPNVGLLASRFISRATKMADIEFEVLLYPEHVHNFGFFADAEDAIRARVGELFEAAEALGLAYPYDGLSLVETPNALRAYGGGWRMDSVQSMPGVMMMRESSFPTARFEARFANPADFEDLEGGIGEAKLAALEQYFANDFNGGNLFMGVARNFLHFQSSATGEGAHAVNFVLDELVTRLLTDKSGYFSAHEFDNSINIILNLIVQNLAQGQIDEIGPALRLVTTHRPSVWDRALGASLADLDLTNAPRTALNVVSLRSDAISRAIVDGIGRQKAASLLSALIDQYRGEHYSTADLYRIAERLGISLQPLLGDWLHDAALPGFLMSAVDTHRLTDDEHGNPRYQTRLLIRNDEDTPGLMHLRYQWGSKKEPVWDTTEPVRIASNSSMEVGMVTSTPLFQLWTQPYLALNRIEQRLKLPGVDSEQQIDAGPLQGHRRSDWEPTVTGDIIVDDLDEGFSIQGERDPDVDRDMDQGLPEYQLRFGQPQFWSRAVYYDSWGKYRRTHALVHPGEGNSHAEIKANLPKEGRWQLSYYLGINTGENSDP